MERQCWLCLAHIPTHKPTSSSMSSSSSSSALSSMSMSTSSSTSSSSCASPSLASGLSYFSLDRPLLDQETVYVQATSTPTSSSQVSSSLRFDLNLLNHRQSLAPPVKPVKRCSAAKTTCSCTGMYLTIRQIKLQSLEDTQVEKVWAQLTNPCDQLSHQIWVPFFFLFLVCPFFPLFFRQPPCMPPQCRLDAL